jgi:hypothetical protein
MPVRKGLRKAMRQRRFRDLIGRTPPSHQCPPILPTRGISEDPGPEPIPCPCAATAPLSTGLACCSDRRPPRKLRIALMLKDHRGAKLHGNPRTGGGVRR